MKRTAFALVLMGLLAACGTQEKPVDAPLDRATFSRVLAGALLVEARNGEDVLMRGREGEPDLAGYDTLFVQEGVTAADFKATYEAYLKQPGQLKEVYQDALEKLQWLADSLDLGEGHGLPEPD